MAPSRFDHGTLNNTTYSSIHSADAFVGDYRVMYTPGSSPKAERANSKKSTRFSKPTAPSRSRDVSQSFALPANIPNTSQILPDPGSLPNIHGRYPVPPDEKQIVASLRRLQQDFDAAMESIDQLTKERDEALLELRLLRAASQRQSTPKKARTAPQADEELFDISRVVETPKASAAVEPSRRASRKSAPAEIQTARSTASDNARVLSPIPVNQMHSPAVERRASNKHAPNANGASKVVSRRQMAKNGEEGFLDDVTAASNTSRRRRNLDLDENMTSAYILPDITVSQQPQQPQQLQEARIGNSGENRRRVSESAQHILHNTGDPGHVKTCTVCARLTTTKQFKRASHGNITARDFGADGDTDGDLTEGAGSKVDYTAQLTILLKNAHLDEPTLRPKMAPRLALENLKKLLTSQFEEAKGKHRAAWKIYDRIEAPLCSKRHAEAAEQMALWARKMEDARLNLDQLRDVEEGLRGDGQL